MFIFSDPRIPDMERGRKLEGITLYDIAPSVLDCIQTKTPSDMLGEKILSKAQS